MESFFAHCAAAFSQHGSLFAVFFLGGLTGSITHCLAMCGPLVAGQAACAGGCSKRSAANASQWSYHLGRLTTYGALGFAAALFGKQIAALSFWPMLSSIMLVLAGVMFIASAVPPQRVAVCAVSAKTNYARGALMGFMPCGLVYAALMMAATLANPLSGLVAMALFTLGTIPALVLASGSATLLSRTWQHTMQKAGRAMMVFNGLSLLVMAAEGLR